MPQNKPKISRISWGEEIYCLLKQFFLIGLIHFQAEMGTRIWSDNAFSECEKLKSKLQRLRSKTKNRFPAQVVVVAKIKNNDDDKDDC